MWIADYSAPLLYSPKCLAPNGCELWVWRKKEEVSVWPIDLSAVYDNVLGNKERIN